MEQHAQQQTLWKSPATFWLLLGVVVALGGYAFYDTIADMVYRWNTKEEYGYGYLIPVITLFLIWQRKNQLAAMRFSASWAGLVLVALGGVLFFLGAVATTHTLSQYGLVVTVLGAALALLGWEAFKIVMVPLALLFFMVPLPPFIYNTLSTKLQLLSSEIGVAVIRLFGISVYLEGNVIDLGSYKLQVVEACSGLRYLFPLVSLSFITAYIYRGAFWKKAVIFLSSIPITVLMNSFRIGVIGVLVEYGGPEQAEGFLHDFEGWIVFMACIAILILEMALLAKVGSQRQSLAETFAIDFPEPLPAAVGKQVRGITRSSWFVPVLVAVIAAASFYVQGRVNIIPERRIFAEFPLRIAEWSGTTSQVEENILASLKTEDQLMSDYRNDRNENINLWIAYYADQAAGSAAHSPRACIPGGGWLIKDLSQRTVDSVRVNGRPLRVNRLVIKKGDYTQLVYYWFQQRGRDITNEWMVKWFLFWDALTRNRTDGALVRLTALVAPGEDLARADQRLVTFAAAVVPQLAEYIPD
ncbi:MAG: VPLPA-CTERM-specific exosortase XrtD [Pseudomonadota bacterium]